MFKAYVYLKQGSNAEVSTVQIVPAFPLCEHDGAHGQVDKHHQDAGGERGQGPGIVQEYWDHSEQKLQNCDQALLKSSWI